MTDELPELPPEPEGFILASIFGVMVGALAVCQVAFRDLFRREKDDEKTR